MLALSLLLISRLILLLAHLLKLVVATLSSASPIATIGTPLLILLISATALVVVILVLSIRATLVTTAPLSFHRHAHAHSHAHVAAGAAPSKTWERHASLLQGCLYMLRVQLAANLCEERLNFRRLHILHIGSVGDQLVWIREHLGCHSTDHCLRIAVEIVIISVISPILVAALATTATASSALIIIVVATLRLIGSSFSSRVAAVIISIMMIVVGATVAAPVIAAARTATSAT